MSPPEPARRFSVHRFLQRRLRFIAVAMPLACALLLLPFESWLFELLRQFRLWNAVIGIAAALFLSLLRDWKFAAIALVAGLWQGWPVWSWSRPVAQDWHLPAPGHSFSLMSCNLLYECREPARMISAIQEARPDVLLLLEYTPQWQSHFAAALWQDYPHRLEEPDPGYSGIAMASKLPLEDARALLAADSPVLRAIVSVAGQRITILGVHPAPPIAPDDYPWWRDAIAAWPSLLAETRTPHRIVAGDLNCAPFARAFSSLCLSAGLRDSTLGFSVANTWHLKGTVLGLPLDHILVSGNLHVVTRSVLPAPGSDHHAVMATLAPVP